MIFWQLFSVFFKIGLFSFGGGLAMIAVIQQEVVSHGWLTAEEYAQVVTISQMTPGPIAVNTATYVGAKICGPEFANAIFGSLAATVGVCLPSFLIVLVVAGSLSKFKSAPQVKWILNGIRPAVIGFMITAVVLFANITFFRIPIHSAQEFIPAWKNLNYIGIFLTILMFYLHKYRKISAIPLILISGICGMIMY